MAETPHARPYLWRIVAVGVLLTIFGWLYMLRESWFELDIAEQLGLLWWLFGLPLGLGAGKLFARRRPADTDWFMAVGASAYIVSGVFVMALLKLSP